jgi:hypothetical protein
VTLAERIYTRVQEFPEPTQREVLHFVEFLSQKLRQEDVRWSELSLVTALRGMEDEVWPEYDLHDIKEA